LRESFSRDFPLYQAEVPHDMRWISLLKTWTVLILIAATLAAAGCSSAPSAPPVEPEKPPAETPPPPPTTPTQPAPEPPKAENPAPQILLYKPEALLAGETKPFRSAALPPGTETHAMNMQDDRGTAVLYPSPWTQSSGIYLLDLTTGTASKLKGPDPNGWYAYGALLADGRLLLVGNQVWIGDPTGDQFTAVAKVGLTWLVEPSPSGRYLALWGPNQKGNYTLVDLKTGDVQTRTGPFRRCVQDGGVTLAWSPDERYLAGTDCDNDATGEGLRTRIIDPFSGEAVRTLEGKYVVAWLPDGRFLTLKQPGHPSASMLVLDPEGTVLAEMDGYARSSPDGRFLLQVINTGVDTKFLMNLATGERVLLNLPGTLLWTEGNAIYEIR
jgi:hypothetical protein